MPKVNVAIMGCGGMAGAHAGRLKRNSDVQIVGLCDVDEPRVQAFIDRHLADYDPKPAIFTDAARMYAETNGQKGTTRSPRARMSSSAPATSLPPSP